MHSLPLKRKSKQFNFQVNIPSYLLSEPQVLYNFQYGAFSCWNILFSWSSNICYKPIDSHIQSHENNICVRFVSLEQNSLQLLWEIMTYFQHSPLRGSGWNCHFFSLKLWWILFQRDKTDANVILMTLNIRNYRLIANVWGLCDKSIVRPAHVSWADNRIVPCFI